MVSGGVEQVGGHLPVDALGLLNLRDGVFDDLVLVPGVDPAGGEDLLLALLVLANLQTVEGGVLGGVHEEELLRLGGAALRLTDPAQLQHPVEHRLLALLVEVPGGLHGAVVLDELRVPEGVIEGGIVGDAHDAGALGQVQLGDVLAEVALGGGLDAGEAMAEIDVVEVEGEDVLLGVFGVKSRARQISRNLRLTVTSVSPVMFRTSCWVMVEPPWVLPPVALESMARAVPYQSTPLCSQKRWSSMATMALTRQSGRSLYLMSSRLLSLVWSVLRTCCCPLASS